MSSVLLNTPGARFATNENVATITAYDIYDRDYHKKLFGKVPRYGALSWMKAAKGYMTKRTAKNFSYYYHEEGQWASKAATIGSVVDNTTSIDLTLSTGDHEDSGTSSYPIIGDTVVFETEAAGLVTNVNRAVANAHVCTIKPFVSTDTTLALSAISGTSIVFYSNAQKEASDQRSTRIPKTSKVTNIVQTFRADYEVTDHASLIETEFEYMGQKFLFVKGLEDTSDTFRMDEDNGLLINPTSSGLADAGTNAIRIAKGLVPQITDSGNTMEYFGTPDGGSTIDDAIMILNRNQGDKEYIVGQSVKVALGWKQWLVDFAKGGDTNISFNAFDGNGKQALSMNFESISVSGYSFHFNTWDLFSHSDSLGAGNMPYQDMAVFIPTGKTKNPEPGDGFSDYEPYLQVVYMNPPTGGNGVKQQFNGDYFLWESGAYAKPGATSPVAKRVVSMISYKSLEVRRRNAFLVMRRAS
jgi:hypothetical protein